MILYVVGSLLLAFVHALKVLNKWILWESNHPPKKSSLPNTEQQHIHLTTHKNQPFKELEKSLHLSTYPPQFMTYDENKKSKCQLDISFPEDVRLSKQWLHTVNAYSQYGYMTSFQTPILYAKSDTWKDRLNQVSSLKYIIQVFIQYRTDKDKQFERMITVQRGDTLHPDKENRLMTNPEFVSYSNAAWSFRPVHERSVLLKLYPVLIILNIILGVIVNPIFGFLALLQVFIYAIVDFLVLSKLATFYSLPKTTKWYIVSFGFHFKDMFTSLLTSNFIHM